MIALAEIGIVIVLVTSLFVVGCITIPHCLTSYSYYILWLYYSTSLVFRCAPCSHSTQVAII